MLSAGLKYPLDGGVISVGSRGMSNEISQPPATLQGLAGIIVVFIEKSISLSFGCAAREGTRVAGCGIENSFPSARVADVAIYGSYGDRGRHSHL